MRKQPYSGHVGTAVFDPKPPFGHLGQDQYIDMSFCMRPFGTSMIGTLSVEDSMPQSTICSAESSANTLTVCRLLRPARSLTPAFCKAEPARGM